MISISGDYASIDTKEWSAYYGYEVTKCSIDSSLNCNCEYEDCEPEWCFQLTDKFNVRKTIPYSKLKEHQSKLDEHEVERCLLVGIGLCLITRGDSNV